MGAEMDASAVLGAVLFAVPNLFDQESLDSSYPEWLPDEKVNLGLDLQGGSHLLLEVQVDKVIDERIDALVDDTRRILRSNRIGYQGLKKLGQAAVLQLTDITDYDTATELLTDLDSEVSVKSDSSGAFSLELKN